MRRYGHVGQTWWARGQLAGNAYELGRWDEALEHIEAVLAYVAAGTPHYFESGCRLSRAAISFARGDDRTFAEDIDRSLELAAKATDPQATAPVVAVVACLRAWGGDLRGARELLDSALETARSWEFGFEMIEYESRSRLRSWISIGSSSVFHPWRFWTRREDAPRRRSTITTFWPRPTRSRTSEMQATRQISGSAPASACSLRAASRRAWQQLERALAFYRGVRATRFIAEAESLLAGAAQRSA